MIAVSRATIAVLALWCVAKIDAQWIPDNPVRSVQKESGGITLTLEHGAMRIAVLTPSLLHVCVSPTGNFPERKEFAVLPHDWQPVSFDFKESAKSYVLATSELKVTIDPANATLTYFGAKGQNLLSDGPRKFDETHVNGEPTHHAEDVFKIYGSEEAFYGLGQHQSGVWNYRGTEVELSQENTEIAIPMLLSSKGYGIFWNNPSVTKVNNRFIHYLYISSQVADTIDYYFLYGPSFDRIISDYRTLTGAAPMFGKWAYGFWQCKNRYRSQQEILDVAHRYRSEQIPIDNIVQDWFWWTRTGEFVFNKNYPDPKAMIDDLHRNHLHLMISVWPFFYPGTDTYRDMDRRGFFIDRTKTESFHPKGTALYDAFSPAARGYYWNLIDKSLFQIGADAWWMDTTEPETEGQPENVLLSNKTAIGNGARYANLYPLMTTMAVAEGQRAESSDKRVFILSRSAYAGIQRNGVTAWSGDVLSDWTTFKRQLPAALNFEVSGLPYWTSDIGGFILGHPNDPGYRELFIRWFQFGAFCPIFRVHGTRVPDQNELWSYGADAQKILVAFDRLRYRLMPYIYSVASRVTREAYTPMRPLVMDFADDPRALNIGDQFLFGPSILVNPVTEQQATVRRLYLPATADWYDFWDGSRQAGGREIEAPAPLDRMPLYVRAGSVLPLAQDMQWAMQKPDAPTEIRVYPGANGGFTLYEDEGDNYNYEKGAFATIPLTWDDTAGTLRIGTRQGSYPGMPFTRTLNIVFVNGSHGSGPELTSVPDQTVTYSGQPIEVHRQISRRRVQVRPLAVH